MSQINDGGPAFPGASGPGTHMTDANGQAYAAYPTSAGMTLRDFFAAHALTGFLAANAPQRNSDPIGLVAKASYAVADAMLREREA